MKLIMYASLLGLLLALPLAGAWADDEEEAKYQDAIHIFMDTGASTAGASAGACGGKNDATTVGSYYKGMAVFIVARGGLMYEASVSGQKFTYTPK